MMNEKELSKAAKIVPQTNFVLSEFMAMLAGEKPAIVTSFQNKGEDRFIKTNFPGLFIAMGHGSWYMKDPILAISRNKESARQAANYLNEVSIEAQGRILGYPNCCSKRHADFCRDGKALDSSFVIFKTHQSSGKHNYLLNNLFNFYSRLGMNQERFNDFIQYGKVNERILGFHAFHLEYISHIPCRYDCPKSVKIGRRTESILKKYAPVMENRIKYCLAKPVLFFDLFNLVVFDGYCEGDTLFYSKVAPPYFPPASAWVALLKEGNRIVVSGRRITIYDGNKKLFSHKKKSIRDGFIIDFK